MTLPAFVYTAPTRRDIGHVASYPLDPPRPDRDDPAFRICGLSEGEGRGVPRCRMPENDDE